MNLPQTLMGVAAGIAILAALTHGLIGFARRPRDRARITFAVAAAAAATAALSVHALYAITDIDVHVAVMKWAYFPATVVWTIAIVWFVAFVADVRPTRFLLALSGGFAFTLVVNVVLPRGILHQQKGGLMPMETVGGSVMVMTNSSPHVLQNVTDALTLISFGFICYAVYRVYRRPGHERAGYLGLMTALLAVATLIDAIIEHRVVISFNTLYLSQLSFAVVIIAVSLALRRESLRVETELQLYRTHMDELVEARVRELDEANAKLEYETEERRATEEVLRRRLAELDALRRIAQLLGGRTVRGEALDEATSAIARLFSARHARVRLLKEAEAEEDGAEATTAGTEATFGEEEDAQPLTMLDLAVSDAAMRDKLLIAEDAAAWPGLPAELQDQAATDGVGSVLATPLTGTSGPAGALVIVRGADSGPFSSDERQLADDRRRRPGRGDRDRPPAPQRDAAGCPGGAPEARPRPPRLRHAEPLQRHPDRGGAARRVGPRPRGRHSPPRAPAAPGARGDGRDAYSAVRAPSLRSGGDAAGRSPRATRRRARGSSPG